MPKMPIRDQLRNEFDAAVLEIDRARGGSNLTTEFYSRIGDSVFEAGFSALTDTCDHGGHPRSPAKTKEPHRLHVVSAPVGSGKTSFAMALIASVVRLQQRCQDAPFGCLWVVDQMTKADEMYRDLNQLLPGKVAVWSTDHDPQCKHPTKVHSPTARFTKEDLQHYPVAIVTHAFFGGKGSHKARQVLHGGRLQPAEQTIDHQLAHARAAGFAIDEVVADNGVSGFSTRLTERPEGRRLYDKLRKGDTLVVRWVDRLGRNYEDVCDTIRHFMRRGVVIRTVINNFTFDGATKDPMRQAVRDALIAFMAATAQAQAEATKAAQRAGIEHAKQHGDRAYLGRKRNMLGQEAVGIARIAKETGLTRQTVYRIKDDPAGSEAALAAWEQR
jgi:putative DNA-invertase from lambdoid prophage Rac